VRFGLPLDDAPDPDELELLLLPQPARASTTVPNTATIERRFTGVPFAERAGTVAAARVSLEFAIALHMQSAWWDIDPLCRGPARAAGPGETIRSILTLLACKYRLVLKQLSLVTGRRVRIIHVVGEPSAGQPSAETYDRCLAVTGLGCKRPGHVEV
jgi:hypothetical protein